MRVWSKTDMTANLPVVVGRDIQSKRTRTQHVCAERNGERTRLRIFMTAADKFAAVDHRRAAEVFKAGFVASIIKQTIDLVGDLFNLTCCLR
jgi:hypothetical protein